MPYDAKTGKEYPYTEEGMEQYKKDTGKGMPIKNMAYWKSKNALPGIEHTSDGNMPDGRSLSSPFQENGTPGDIEWGKKLKKGQQKITKQGRQHAKEAAQKIMKRTKTPPSIKDIYK